MALGAEQVPVRNGLFDDNIEDDDEESPWENLLGEETTSSSKLQEHQSVIVLGDLCTGKTSLFAKLQGNEEPEKGSGLEYTHLTIKDEYRDDSTKLGVWLVDGDCTHAGLLKYALTPDTFKNTMLVITVSMSQPWSILKSLKDWLTIVTDHIDRIGINREVLQECEQKLTKHYQEYVEPDSNTSSRISAPGGEGEAVLLPLADGVLTHNLGLPVIVVVTKSDAISMLEKEYDYKDEKFDYIQYHIRQLCLSYGAALLYTSVREEKNCDLLHKYIAHRVYGLEFTSQASVVDRDSVFIPAGWDSDKKIDILKENLTSISIDDDYDTIIKRPQGLRRPANRDGEVSADPEQDFLTKCNALLAKGAPATANVKVEPTTPLTKTPSKTSMTRLSTPPSSGTVSPKKSAGDASKPGSQQGETVLANFFNSLLTKKTGTPTKSSPDTKSAAAAELDRMTRNSKPS